MPPATHQSKYMLTEVLKILFYFLLNKYIYECTYIFKETKTFIYLNMESRKFIYFSSKTIFISEEEVVIFLKDRIQLFCQIVSVKFCLELFRELLACY